MIDILKKFISILDTVLSLVDASMTLEAKTNTITGLLLETTATKSNQRFIIKPGFPKTISTAIQNILKGEPLDKTHTALIPYSLNELMGAIYGAVTHNGVFHLIFSYCKQQTFIEKHGNRLSRELDEIMATLRNLFGLSMTFDDTAFFRLAGDGNNICLRQQGSSNCFTLEKGGWLNILLDMMVYRDGQSRMSIVKRNLNNLEYVRTRVPKEPNTHYKASKLEASHCPIFGRHEGQEALMLVNGDTWYHPGENNFYSKLMASHNRQVKAGPSGSTFMWMNFVFSLIGLEKTTENHKLLLLCIIADFVPYFHSLAEVLFVFSREFDKVQLYNIDENPAVWLANVFNLESGKYDIDNIVEHLNTKIADYLHFRFCTE